MRICIVTVYDSINSGSYWQAYALGQTLKMQGYEVYYYKRPQKDASSSLAVQLKNILRKLLSLRIVETLDYIRQIISFKKRQQDFSTIDKSNKEYEHINYFILGSDTIWNLNSAYFKNNKTTFWGDIFCNKKVISYAGSIANTKRELLDDNNCACSIKNWKSISVRDGYTKVSFSKLTDKKIHLVCDPTLLLPENHYKEICAPKTGNYIFLYLFKRLNHNQDCQLRTFAAQKHLGIICCTRRNISTHINRFIINSPYNFMAYMLGAKYIVTDNYHGTVFSTNFNKQFVVINRDLIKVQDFLSMIGLTDRIVDSETDINYSMNQTINYDNANQKIQELKRDSLMFLKESLNSNRYEDTTEC